MKTGIRRIHKHPITSQKVVTFTFDGKWPVKSEARAGTHNGLFVYALSKVAAPLERE